MKTKYIPKDEKPIFKHLAAIVQTIFICGFTLFVKYFL